MNLIKSTSYQKLFLIILLFGLSVRLYKIDIPLLEFYPSRQIQTAEITKNLFYDSEFLKPKVSYLGPEKKIFLLEAPIYNSIVVLTYKIFGGVNETLGRAVSVWAWLIAAFLIYSISRMFTKNIGSLTALYFYTFSPLSVLISKSFQPDQWMITFSLAAIFTLLKWTKNKKVVYFVISSIFASLAILTKLPAIIFLLFPLLLLILTTKLKIGRLFFLYFFVACLPVGVWTAYGFLLKDFSGVSHSAFSVGNWFGINLFWNRQYYYNVFGFEYHLVLLPTGILLFIVGIFQKLKPDQRFLYFWLFGVFAYFIIFNKHNMTHEYYHLPMLPIACLFIGIACENMWSSLIRRISVKPSLIIFVLVAFTLITMLAPTYQRAYKPIDRFNYVIETADVINKNTGPNDLVIGSMDAGPALVFYSQRRGWGFDVQRNKILENFSFYGVSNMVVSDAIDEVEKLRSQGAVIFASSYKNHLLLNKNFSDYMYKKYTTIADNDNYVVFNLIEK